MSFARNPVIYVFTLMICTAVLTVLMAPDAHPSQSSSQPATGGAELPAVYPLHQGPPSEEPQASTIQTQVPKQSQVSQPAAPVQSVRAQPQLSIPAPTSKIEIVIQFTLAQVGKPYRWGGAGPNSYDCSGLVMVAFSKIGLRLPHYTGALIGKGVRVARAGLQRGDLVFPSDHHVAIYLGNGLMVHAPQPGERVKVSSVYAFYAGRRLA